MLPRSPGGRKRIIGFALGNRLEVESSAHLGQLQVPGSHFLFLIWPRTISPLRWELFHFLLSFSLTRFKRPLSFCWHCQHLQFYLERAGAGAWGLCGSGVSWEQARLPELPSESRLRGLRSPHTWEPDRPAVLAGPRSLRGGIRAVRAAELWRACFFCTFSYGRGRACQHAGRCQFSSAALQGSSIGNSVRTELEIFMLDKGH